jgi:hypothetical protein
MSEMLTQKCDDTRKFMSPKLACRDENRQHFALSPTLPAKAVAARGKDTTRGKDSTRSKNATRGEAADDIL